MKVLHISPSYKPAYRYGGPVVTTSRLAEELAKAGANVTVFTTTANGRAELPAPPGERQILDGVNVVYFRRWTGDHGHFSPPLLRAFWKFCKEFDVIHIHSWWNWVAFGTALICRLRGIKPVVSPHGMLSPYSIRRRLRPWLQRNIGHWLLAKAVLHATSRQELFELSALHPGLSIIEVPNIVDLPVPSPCEAKAAVSSPRLLFLSRIDPKKGLDILFKALARMNSPEWQLVVAGAGEADYQERLKTLAAGLGLARRVAWVGWVEGQAKWNLLADCDLMVLPSHNENFALVVLEALALGTSVVVSDRVGLSNYVASRDFGWVSRAEPEALCRTLEIALADRKKRKNIRRSAPGLVRRDFEPGRIAGLYLQYYAALRQKQQGAGHAATTK